VGLKRPGKKPPANPAGLARDQSDFSMSSRATVRDGPGRDYPGFGHRAPADGRASALERPASWEFRVSRERRHSPWPREPQALGRERVEE